MNDIQTARKFFDIGILSLGLPLNGQLVPTDIEYAQKAFRQATDHFPDMCDAWLGAYIAGDHSQEVWENLYRSAPLSLGREQRRVGLGRRQFQGRFYTGAYIEYSLYSFVEICAGYAAYLISKGEYVAANEVFETLEERLRSQAPSADQNGENIISTYVKGVLYHRTARWPDVISTLSTADSWSDNYVATCASLMAGSACAYLGYFSEALRKLDRAENGSIPGVKLEAMFCHGLVLREQGKETEARAIFEKIFFIDQSYGPNNDALANSSYRLLITDKATIDARSDPWKADTAESLQEKQDKAAEDRIAGILVEAQEELDRQIGLSEVKTQVAKLKASATLAKVRADKGFATGAKSLHLAFTGPPGTGKTTIARIVAKIYCGLGLLKTDTVVEAARKDLVGQYLGHTAEKTSKLIDSAMDGVLFIDEAYTLIQTGLSNGDAFGQEAVDTLLARMENDRDRLVVIIAGYDTEIDRFLESNEGLSSRFARRVRFSFYSADELAQIAQAIAKSRDTDISPEALDLLCHRCEELINRQIPDKEGKLRRGIDLAGNGRFIRNIVEAAEEEREFRLASNDDTDVTELTEDALRLVTAADMINALDAVSSVRS